MESPGRMPVSKRTEFLASSCKSPGSATLPCQRKTCFSFHHHHHHHPPLLTLLGCSTCWLSTQGHRQSQLLQSWALFFIFCLSHLLIFALSVTHSPLVPSHATRTAIQSPDKSPDESLNYSAVNYHMLLLHNHQLMM